MEKKIKNMFGVREKIKICTGDPQKIEIFGGGVAQKNVQGVPGEKYVRGGSAKKKCFSEQKKI